MAFFGYVPEIKIISDHRPNAYALAPHTLVITKGLIELSDHEDELAFVIAHELGHLSLHSEKAISALSGNRIDRLYKQELEADTYALKLLREARIEPDRGVRLLKRIQNFGSKRGVRFGTAYPSLKIRLQVLERSLH